MTAIASKQPEADVVIKNLRELYDAQGELVADAERKRQEAHNHLVRVAVALCRGALDRAKSTRLGEPSQWPSKDVADLIIGEVGRQLDTLDLGLEDTGRLLALIKSLQAQVEQTSHPTLEAELQRQVNELKSRLAIDQQDNANLRQRLAAAEKKIVERTGQPTLFDLRHETPAQKVQNPAQLAQHTAPSQPAVPGILPEWIQTWRQASKYERDAALLQYMGDTGEFRRNKLRAWLTETYALPTSSGSLTRIFNALADMGVIVIQEEIRIKSIAGTPGHPPAVILLTEKGRDGYRALFGRDPYLLFDELMKRHKSPEHLYLNVEAADILELYGGYSVDRLPAEMYLPDGKKFMPDLIASLSDGPTLYIECEMLFKTPDERAWKWDIFYTATGGRLYIITPDKKSALTIRGEILFHTKAKAPQPTLWITDIQEVRAGGRSAKDGSLWIYQQ